MIFFIRVDWKKFLGTTNETNIVSTASQAWQQSTKTCLRLATVAYFFMRESSNILHLMCMHHADHLRRLVDATQDQHIC